MSQPEGAEIPMPMSKLAPIPSKDALFGELNKKKIDALSFHFW